MFWVPLREDNGRQTEYNSWVNFIPEDWIEIAFGIIRLLSQSVSSVAQLCPTLCNPMDCSMPGSPVHQQLLELTQTDVHPVGDAIQSFHPLSSPSPPAFNLSQHQGLFQ